MGEITLTVEERLLFIRAGYSAQDIAGFEAAESVADPAPAAEPKPAPVSDPAPAPAADPKPAPAPAAEPAPAADLKPAPAPAAEMPAWAVALQESLEDLTRATQAANARFDDMGDPLTMQQEAENALAEYLTGTNPAKAAIKTHTGGKRK